MHGRLAPKDSRIPPEFRPVITPNIIPCMLTAQMTFNLGPQNAGAILPTLLHPSRSPILKFMPLVILPSTFLGVFIGSQLA